jgi:hypothetical protein
MHRKFVKTRDYRKIAVKITMAGQTTSYTGSYEDLEFEGNTIGDELDIRDVLSRMLTARKDIPDSLMSVVTLVVSYIELMVNAGVWYVSTNAGYEFRGDCEVGVKVSVFYDYGEGEGDNQEAGWVVNLRAYFEGYDGLSTESRHEIKKKLRYGEKLDVDAVRAELTSLVKMVYNTHKGGPGRVPCV